MPQTILTAFVEPTRYENPVLFVPAGLAAVSAIILAFRASKVLGRGKIGPNDVQSSEFNAGHVLIFKVLRSISSVVLLGISAYELGTQTDLVHISLFCFYIYATVLSFISHSAPTRSWRTVAAKHVATLYIAIFVIYAYRSLKQFATYENGVKQDGRVIGWVRFGFLGIAGALVPLFSPRLFVSTPPHTIPNPAETASYFSLLTFSYLDRIIMMAYRTPHLGLDQLPHLSEKDTSSFLTAKAFPLIDPVVVNYKKGHIFWRLLKVLRWDYLIMVLYNIALSLINFVAPLSLKKLLEYLEGNNTEGAIRPWIWLVLIALGPITASITEQQLLIFATRVMVRTEAVLTQLVFEHSLRIRLSVPAEHKKSEQKISPTAKVTPTAHVLSEAALETEEDAVSTVLVTESLANESTQTRTEGPAARAPASTAAEAKDSLVATMTNLITTDLGVIKIPSGYILDPPFAVVQVLLAVGFLYVILGWSALLGALTIVISIPVPTLLGKLIMKTQKEKMEYTDKRLRIVTQNINVMRMIKLFAWESKVETQIFEQREKELRMVRKGRIYDNIAMFLQGLLPLSTMVITYATYTLVMKQELTASIVFSSMAIFEMLRGTIQHTFWTAPTFLRAKVSLDRFNDFFAKAELLKSLESADIETTPDVTLDEEIKFYPSTHTWNKHDHYGDVAATSAGHRFVLRIEEELTFQHGAINLILGPTASGKSSVLMALLGEMYSNARDGGRSYVFPRDGGIAYAAQESWVFNDTIRNNIIFNEAFDQDQYTNVIEQCALEPDISRFETGDLTEIGEKGITLSGGQKARITLARAVYSSAQTLLLDDVLSALDVHTAKWIVEKCFQGTLIKGRTVLLVTHNVALVAPAANFAVELSSDGHVLHQGPLKDIMRKTSLLKEAEKELEMQEKATLLDGDATAAKEVDESQKGKLIVAEEIALGRVAWPAIRLYTHSVGGPLFWMTLVGGLYLALVLSAFQVWFLGYWASQYTAGDNVSVPVAKFLGIFTLIATVGSAAFSITAIFYVFGKIRASRSIHAKLITSILRAPFRWLDTVPLARIISRCTTDMEIIDDTLGNELWNLIGLAAMLSVSLAAVIYIAGWRAAVLGVVVAIIGFGFGIIYLKAQLCIKRENSNARSPVISHFQAALGGLVSIRAYGMEIAFKAISRERIDKYIRSSLTQYDLNRWIAVRSDTLGGIFSGLIGAYLVYGDRQTFAAGDVGFALNQIFSFSQTLLYLVRIYNMFEVEANSVERIYDFLVIDQEPLPTEVCKPPAYWPASGNLVTKNLSAQYSKDGPFVLQDISFDIKSGERVGIVGRTGAGKSTLALALLRGIPTRGEVFYDGMDTAKLNLDALRSSITLIPQQPELMAGSLRENIDPFSQYDDATLNDTLHSAGLYDISSSLTHSSPQNITLDTQIDAGGSNFSLGQRQIVALARALLRKCKVLLLDEATASIDHVTDEVIQRSIRTELSKDTTVITIAHRLQSIMDSDRVIVLDEGRLVEFDSPSVLLRREHSLLKDLVDESIDREKLRKMAGL